MVTASAGITLGCEGLLLQQGDGWNPCARDYTEIKRSLIFLLSEMFGLRTVESLLK